MAEIPVQEMRAQITAYEKAILDYISECDNPVPDYNHRRTLRNHLRVLVGAPSEPQPKRPNR
jgi:hypothetical protein